MRLSGAGTSWQLLLLASSVRSQSAVSSVYAAVPSTVPYPNTTYPNATDPNDHPSAFSPPYYPSPWGSGEDYADWADAYDKARAFVEQLTLLEKVNLTTGVGWELERCVGQTGSIPRLGFRSLCLQDSPMGVRDTDFNSAFPGGVTIAATFDRGLLYQRGYDMGSEHRDKGVDVQLGPVAGPLGRSPEGGRNWEGFSPDPVLTGVGMSETIRGIQDAGTIACAKHYIGNEQEHFRQAPEAFNYGFTEVVQSLSSNIDDATLHELYLWPFADAVRAGVGSVMCSYNQLNNSYGCQNSYTMNKLLKGELGFQGFIVSDWTAQLTGVASALAGLDMTMPGDTAFDTGRSFWGANLTLAVLNGTVPQWRLDDMAVRIVAAWYKVGRDTKQKPINFDSWTTDTYGPQHFAVGQGQTLINEHVDVRGDHAQNIREAAAKGTVLLKNENNALPLKKPKFLAVIGNDAGDGQDGPNGCSDRGCDNGTLAQGWGSGTANYPYLISPLTALQNQAIPEGTIVQGITDNYADMQIAALAGQADVAMVFVNADSGEGYINVDGNEGDRNNLTLWQSGDALIKNVSAINNNTIVVMHTVGPVLIDAWYNNPNITAILWAGLPGQESGNSLTDILYGRTNPGRTPFTWGVAREDWGTDVLYEPNGPTPQDNFEEGPFIDYRAFDKHGIDPIYEFGYGLSWTTFSYSNLQINKLGNATAYTPTTGETAPAPTLGSHSNDLADYQFPDGFDAIPLYIYPYLNTTDAKTSADDKNFATGGNGSFPAAAQDSSPQPKLPASGGPGGNPQLYDVLYEVSATITNTGSVVGEEIPQLYISLGGDNDAKVALRAFDRLSIQPGGTATFFAQLTRRDLSNWDTASQNWVISTSPKTVHVGSSSRKLPLSGSLS
ncbi:MAG: hypothetical protein M4579_005036 [Chaenotheca gracillima]|nr:MAG: hypothetical protein M4579_005036 [Chaenotheca gracillima]